MSAKIDGGAAFPEISTVSSFENGQVYGDTYSHGGMTLRDWFAGQALAGHLANPVSIKATGKLSSSHEETTRRIATTAYLLADAMLAERAK